MYCKYCGKEVYHDAVVCVHCGRSLVETKQCSTYDTGSLGWGVLGFFVPLAGLILYLVWNKERPKDAKKAGLGALIGVVTGIVFYILFFALIMRIMSGMW